MFELVENLSYKLLLDSLRSLEDKFKNLVSIVLTRFFYDSQLDKNLNI